MSIDENVIIFQTKYVSKLVYVCVYMCTNMCVPLYTSENRFIFCEFNINDAMQYATVGISVNIAIQSCAVVDLTSQIT